MLLQTNSYFVPKDKRVEHARLLRRFRTALARVGCDHFEVFEQVGSNWNVAETTGRFVQIMRFRDRKHQQAVQAAERKDTGAQAVIQEFCDLINFPYQQQQGLFAVGFYTSVLPAVPSRVTPESRQPAASPAEIAAVPSDESEPDPRAEIAADRAPGSAPADSEEDRDAPAVDIGNPPMDHSFGAAPEGDFEDAMQRLRPIDINGAPHGAPASQPLKGRAVTVELAGSGSSDEPPWSAAAELVEANELEGISEDDALAELEGDQFLPGEVVSRGENDTPNSHALPDENDLSILQPGQEAEHSVSRLNGELADAEMGDEVTISHEAKPGDIEHPDPGGGAWR